MNAIKAAGLALLALLVAAPAFADGRERGHDRRRDHDRGSHWSGRDGHRDWNRGRDRDDHRDWKRGRGRHDERRFDPRRHWQWGFRGREEETRRSHRYRDHHRWSKRYRNRPNVVIISPSGLLGRMSY